MVFFMLAIYFALQDATQLCAVLSNKKQNFLRSIGLRQMSAGPLVTSPQLCCILLRKMYQKCLFASGQNANTNVYILRSKKV